MEEIQGYVKQNLARYKVPREVVFVEELPRNATGKILKRELAATELSTPASPLAWGCALADPSLRPRQPATCAQARAGALS